MVVPVLPDQAFWASRVASLGAGPPPIPHKELSAEKLSAAVEEATTNPGIRRRCEILGSKIAAEDGVARAVEEFGRHADKTPRRGA